MFRCVTGALGCVAGGTAHILTEEYVGITIGVAPDSDTHQYGQWGCARFRINVRS